MFSKKLTYKNTQLQEKFKTKSTLLNVKITISNTSNKENKCHIPDLAQTYMHVENDRLKPGFVFPKITNVVLYFVFICVYKNRCY